MAGNLTLPVKKTNLLRICLNNRTVAIFSPFPLAWDWFKCAIHPHRLRLLFSWSRAMLWKLMKLPTSGTTGIYNTLCCINLQCSSKATVMLVLFKHWILAKRPLPPKGVCQTSLSRIAVDFCLQEEKWIQLPRFISHLQLPNEVFLLLPLSQDTTPQGQSSEQTIQASSAERQIWCRYIQYSPTPLLHQACPHPQVYQHNYIYKCL